MLKDSMGNYERTQSGRGSTLEMSGSTTTRLSLLSEQDVGNVESELWGRNGKMLSTMSLRH